MVGFGQKANPSNVPMVIAWQAPTCVFPNYCSPAGTNPMFDHFMQSALSSVSGIGVTVSWASIDKGCTNVQNPPNYPAECTTLRSSCSIAAQWSDFNFCELDKDLLAYINYSGTGTPFTGKRIAIIIWGASDQNPNNSFDTPSYVFTTAWASDPRVSSQPQDAIVCGAWPGNVNSGTSCPVVLGSASKVGNKDFAIWNAGTLPNSCVILSGGGDLKCSTTCSSLEFGGFPIVYEKPYMVGYQNFLRAFAQYYSPTSPNPNGRQIAPYIGYVRVGLGQGGENQPFCATLGTIIPPTTITTSAQTPAGYLVETNGNLYVATGSGKGTSANIPACDTPGCTGGPDGTIPGWYNTGMYTSGASTNAMWPGPAGVQGGQSKQYTDNGYLSQFPNGATGYVASMVSFLKGLGASFPFAISAHNGPPADSTVAYADSNAIMASLNGIGFGMQTLSVADSFTYAAGQYSATSPYAPSVSDWVHNFRTLPAPVHYLQSYYPGSNGSFAAGYPISSISINSPAAGIITISCVSDCSFYAGGPIYITGSADSGMNGIWPTTCATTATGTCVSSTNNIELAPMPFPTGLIGGNNGIVWSPNYWPITMPFGIQSDATSFEIYECDLDFALGLYPGNTTTSWVMSGNGCIEPQSIGGITTPVAGPGTSGYPNALNSAIIGQPTSTGTQTNNTIMIKGTQF